MATKADWDHLVKITMANLPQGKLNLTEADVIGAMQKAVAKEHDMAMQLLTNRQKQEDFAAIIGPMAWESAHA